MCQGQNLSEIAPIRGDGNPSIESIADWWFGTMEFYDFPY
jgi:hypothetical protein